jgi:hypothetical protein
LQLFIGELMKKWTVILISILVFSVVLTACSGESASVAEELREIGPTAVMEAVSGADKTLSTDYRDALPLDQQLAFGTLQLENTDLAVTADQAETLLPYWRVLQSLNQSDNTAEAEVNAVVKQIQEAMSGDQISAIAAMQLTQEKLQTMLEDGSINFGFGRGQGGNTNGSGNNLRQGGGGFPGGGGPGGGAGGGFPGGGPGGGGAPGGGAPGEGLPDGFSGQGTDQSGSQATADPTAMLGQMSSNIVIRLLETKTGEVPQRGFGGMDAAFSEAAKLSGLSEEELNQAMADGQTLGEILQENGVSIEEAKAAMIEAMADVQLPEGTDLESWVENILFGTRGLPPDGGTPPRAPDTGSQS